MKVYELMKVLANVCRYAPEAEVHVTLEGTASDDGRYEREVEKMVEAYDERDPITNERILVLTSKRHGT
jgi:hypothetical protein